MRAMILHAGLHKNLNNVLWSKCMEIRTNIKNIVIKPHKEICAYEKFYGNMLDYASDLKHLG